MISKLISSCAQKRARNLLDNLSPMLPKEGTLLDFGCGIGYFGYEVETQTTCRLTYLDVRSYPFMHPTIQVKYYNGTQIPCSNCYYDNAMAIFTLHHTKDVRESLRELVRVTGKYIVVCEDFIAITEHKYILVAKDLLSNCLFSTISLQYKQDHEWESIFSDFGLVIRTKKHFSTSFFPFRFKHVAWLLENNT